LIKKIISIKSVSKFINLAAAGNVEFNKMTLVYGENGKGKSTLATIFRSLSTNDASYVLAKKTIGCTEPQKIQILFEGNEIITFENNKWDSQNEDIVVFDENYINENVHSGNYVSPQNKQNLFYLVVGQNSVKKAIGIEGVDEKIRDLQTRIKKGNELICQHIKINLDIDSFIQLVEDPGIDNKLSAVEKEIFSLRQSEEIKTKNKLNSINLPDIDFKQLKGLLATTIDNIDEIAINKFSKYTESKSIDENWIHKGLDNIQNDICPFCKQSINGLEAIKIYKQYFNEELKELKEKIDKTKLDFLHSFSEEILLRIQSNLSGNLTLMEFWNNHLPEKNEIENYSAEIISIRGKIQELINQHIDRKIQSILTPIDFSDELNDAIRNWGKIKSQINEYNFKVVNVNDKIEKQKELISEISIQFVEENKKKLENIKERYSEPVKTLISNQFQMQLELDQLNQQKSELQTELKTETDDTLNKYKDQINELLCNKFGLNFRITNPKTTFSGRKTNTNYCLEINNEMIPLGTAETTDRPSFRTTLSSGEKSSLAFAFFITQIERLSNLEKRLIIIDDPVTGVDEDRKECIRDEIVALNNKVKQIVVLSYDPFFLNLVKENIHKSNLKTLCIVRNNGTSTIIDWKIEDSIKSQYFRDCEKLQNYLVHGGDLKDFRDVARAIRPVLEGNLRIRYPFVFQDEQWLGNFIKLAEQDSTDDFSTLKPHLLELNEINDFSKKFHHEIDPSASQNLAQLTDAKLKPWVERTMNFLKGLG